MGYKGRFTRTGNSKSYAFEAALFRSHPEFDACNVEADYIGPNVLLVRTVEPEDDMTTGEDPVLDAFLAFVARDMVDNPADIQPLSDELLSRAERLVRNVEVDLNERVD